MKNYDFIFYFPHPVMLVGESGMGKTSFVEQKAQEMGIECYNIRLSQYEITDLIGIPEKKGDFVQFIPVEFFYAASTRPCFLFFDELNRASLEVRQVVFKIADSLQVGNTKLHKDTKIFAAINPENGNYVVDTLEQAEKNRWAIIEFKPDFQFWHNWIVKQPKMYYPVISFLERKQNYLDGVSITRAGIADIVTRRSWTRLAQTFYSLLFEHPESIMTQNPQEVFLDIAKAYVGDKLATELMIHIRTIMNKEKNYNPFFYILQCTQEMIPVGDAIQIFEWLKTNTANQTIGEDEKNLLYRFTNKMPNNELKANWLYVLENFYGQK
ncbi:MAG: AAA family ATPase [Patescibacteria group bacterium]|nr:AAA family ATPase [Patescibacteria group bacterium]